MKDALKVAMLAPVMAAVAVGAYALDRDGDDTSSRLQCVTGDAAVNPTTTASDGEPLTLPTDERFDTIEDVEAWVCHNIPYPRDPGDWRFEGAVAHRSHGLDVLKEGRGFWAATLGYRGQSRDVILRLDVVAGGNVGPCGQDRAAVVNGQPAVIYEGCSRPSHFIIEWEQDGVTLNAGGFLRNGLELDDVLTLLETVE